MPRLGSRARRRDGGDEVSESQQGRPEGEDHREGAPGYDLDEQAAYEEGAGAGGGEEEPSSRDAAADEESPNPPD